MSEENFDELEEDEDDVDAEGNNIAEEALAEIMNEQGVSRAEAKKIREVMKAFGVSAVDAAEMRREGM